MSAQDELRTAGSTKLVGAGPDGIEKEFIDSDHGMAGAIAENRFHAIKGKSFSSITGLNPIGGTVETPYLLLRNPVGSGVEVRIFRGSFGVDSSQSRGIFRGYVNPTVTADGTALAKNNNRAGGPASVIQAFRFPTTSSNGLQVLSRITTPSDGIKDFEIDHYLIVPPSFSLLITVQNTQNNQSSYAGLIWIEI